MWLCLNDGFYSIVEDRQNRNNLLIRARSRKHLQNFLRWGKKGANVKIKETPDSDYRYRVSLPAFTVGEIMAARVVAIDYDNFKDSVHETALHDMYEGWWFDHMEYQRERT